MLKKCNFDQLLEIQYGFIAAYLFDGEIPITSRKGSAFNGFSNPISGKMKSDIENEGRYLSVIKAALVALQRGAPPLVCVEFARRSIYPVERPTFEEMDTSTKEGKKAA